MQQKSITDSLEDADRSLNLGSLAFQSWRLFLVLSRNAPLFRQFTSRQVHAQHKGSVLGIAWMIVNPLLMMGIYTVVFGLIFGAKYAQVDGLEQSQWTYSLGLFLSLTIFQFFAEAISSAPLIVISQPNLCKKVVFPLEILPAASVGASLTRFMVSIALSLIAIRIFNGSLPKETWFLIVTLFPLALLTLGVTLALSALGVFIRDLAALAQFLTLALLYGSAVFYSASEPKQLSETLWSFLKYNPLLHTIDLSRNAVLWGMPIDWSSWSYTLLFGILSFSIGYALFARLKLAFADVL